MGKSQNTLKIEVWMKGRQGMGVATPLFHWKMPRSSLPGIFTPSENRSPREFVMDLIRIAWVLHIFFTSLAYS
jgi:hypothetical protein